MGFLSPAQKEEIRSRVPLEELLRDYNVELRPAGRKLHGLCPFHSEKTPSFYVDPEKQLYYCYGCEEGGDLFRFVQVIDRVEFPDAVEMLARRAGVVLDTSFRGPGRGGTVALYDALAFASSWFHELLTRDPRGEPARQYLARRGITEEMWRRFGLGYSVGEWDAFLNRATRSAGKGSTGNSSTGNRGERSFEPEVLERAGLLRRRERGAGYYDYFRDRLMFPITDVQHRIIGFGARTLGDEHPKYVNTPTTPIFDKSHVLYGIAQAKEGMRREGQICVVEGYTDVIAAHQAGLDHFVASLGTAFTLQNAKSLGRLARRVVMVFDGDAAGQKASERSLDVLVGNDLDVNVYELEGGRDPCDAILGSGGDEFRRRLESDSLGIFEFKWRRTVGALPSDASPAARARALDEFLHLILRVPNGVARKLILRDFTERLKLAESDVDERLRHLSRTGGNASGGTSTSWSESRQERGTSVVESGYGREIKDDKEAVGEALEPLAERILECLFALPGHAARIWEQVPEGLFGGRLGDVLRESISAQLRENAFSPLRLARELEDAEAHRLIVKLLSRVEKECEQFGEDFQQVWHYCQRDLERWWRRKRVGELRELEARSGGDQERLRAYTSERRRLLKELKK